MRVACYCRVSTNKNEQLESLDTQVNFFQELCKKNGYEIHKVYADEGIKGTQLKNRTQFLKMMDDAKKNRFEKLLCKDVSRLARNTLDFIDSFRKLKNLGIGINFVSLGLDTAQEANEFTLTILAAMAQEESASLSKRVKWGKEKNFKRGLVPNFVFGYDRIDKFTLNINVQEAKIVKQIFDMYLNGYGTSKIAGWLNQEGILTKKNKQNNWHQVVVTQILRNQIYTGKIINKKSEVVDFLTGKRQQLEINPEYIIEKPEIRIIDDKTFYKAQEILSKRRDAFNLMNKKESYKYPFSTLIKCSECGYSFRRLQRQYSEDGKIYKKWTDSLRNAKGKNACINKVIIDEETMEIKIKEFIYNLSDNQNKIKKFALQHFKSIIKEQNKDTKTMQKELNLIIKEKEKYMDMYKNEIINMEELKEYTKEINENIKELQLSLNSCGNELTTFNIEKRIDDYFTDLNNFNFDNIYMKKIIDKILVYPDGKIKVITTLARDLPGLSDRYIL